MHKHHYVPVKHNLVMSIEGHMVVLMAETPDLVWFKCKDIRTCIDYKTIKRESLIG